MSGAGDSPVRQLAAAWQAARAVAAEWAGRTAAVTAESVQRLTADPAIRAVLETWRVTVGWPRRDCECVCAETHPDDMGMCDHRAVITRQVSTSGWGGPLEVPLCAPCAVAQGVAELPR